MSRNIYKKVCDGGRITDKELNQAIKDYTAAHDSLIKLGPAFEVTRKALWQTLITLEDFHAARRR